MMQLLSRALVAAAVIAALGLNAAQSRGETSGGANPAGSFRHCDECPLMTRMPAGSYTMGSPTDEEDRDDDEGPVHQVTIAEPFAVGIFEVTWNEWEACVRDGGCEPIADKGFSADNGWGRGKRPVINVSWLDVQRFLEWLRDETGADYRLLSEAEWEYVARAGTDSTYAFDGGMPKLCFHANGADLSTDFNNRNTCFDGVGRRTAPVGSFEPNAFGLYDTLGNVWEWTADCWNPDYEGAPADGSAWDAGDCSQRTLRGGSWGSYPHDLRSAARYEVDTSYRGHEVGFRVAMDP